MSVALCFPYCIDRKMSVCIKIYICLYIFGRTYMPHKMIIVLGVLEATTKKVETLCKSLVLKLTKHKQSLSLYQSFTFHADSNETDKL